MRSRKLSIVVLMTIVALVAFALPASAAGYISGVVLDQSANPIPGANVTATNSTSGNVYYFYTTSSGTYVITVPAPSTNMEYLVQATKPGYTGSGVQTLLVIDGNTTVAQNIVLVKDLIPTRKTDTAFPASIPADRGASSTLITANITDQDGRPIAYGTVNGTTTAYVNFYLRNGTLNVSTGYNGSLAVEPLYPGTQVDQLTILNVSIDANGLAKVRLYSGYEPGTVTIFDNVTVRDANGNEVNATIDVVFTPLVGHVTGTVRNAEGSRIPNATVFAYRLLWVYNNTDLTWARVLEPVKGATTDSFGDYVLPYIPLKYDNIDNNLTDYYYQYNIETVSNDTMLAQGSIDTPPPLVRPPNGSSIDLLTNIIIVTAGKNPYNNGSAWTFLTVDYTETRDIVLTSGQPDQIYVSIDSSVHQVLDIPDKNANAISTWIVTAQLKKSGVDFAIPDQVITFTVDNPTAGTFSGATTTTATTDVTGKATVTLTSTLSSGTVNVWGSYTTRDNLPLSDFDVARTFRGVAISGDIVDPSGTTIPVQTIVNLWHLNSTTGLPDAFISSVISSPVDLGHYAFVDQPLVYNNTYMVNTTFSTLNGTASGSATFQTLFANQNTVTADIVVQAVGIVPVGTISGKVSNASSGAGISGASIYLDAALKTTTDNTGNYTISNVPVGSHTVKAVATGYADNTAAVTVIGGVTPATANIALTPGSGGSVPGDANGDGTVSDQELLNYIAAWAAGGAGAPTDAQLLAAIAAWSL